VISKGNPNQHHKHALIPRPVGGEYGRNELAILGAPCSTIRLLAQQVTEVLSARWKVAYLDADHQSDKAATDPIIQAGASAVFTNKITHQQLNYAQPELLLFQKKALFNNEDLLLINGNHFTGSHQIIIIDPAKPLEKKLEKLTQVQLILLKDDSTSLPAFLIKHLPGIHSVPTLYINNTVAIAEFINNFLQQRIPPVNGLVLTGGKSQRMGTNKGELNYHGTSQKQHVYQMLAGICNDVFVSVNEQDSNEGTLPVLQDRFTGIGPMGGILTALQSDLNAAWMVVACDLPFLTQSTLQFLLQHRNASKIATAFIEPNGTFPEPLITIWEPKSYALLLQALSQGYTCPRKVLINNDVELLKAPDTKEFENVNDPAAYEIAKAALQSFKLTA
jgi:molybdenum cofactor guanylyltransferase